jgi:hypothetical protein
MPSAGCDDFRILKEPVDLFYEVRRIDAVCVDAHDDLAPGLSDSYVSNAEFPMRSGDGTSRRIAVNDQLASIRCLFVDAADYFVRWPDLEKETSETSFKTVFLVQDWNDYADLHR